VIPKHQNKPETKGEQLPPLQVSLREIKEFLELVLTCVTNSTFTQAGKNHTAIQIN
jgi:hypothetical protein